MTTFHDVQLPTDVERGAQGGPQFHTSILVLASGLEKRNIDWSRQLCTFDISYGIQTKADASEVLEFFYARMGRAYGFRFRDWADYEIGKLSTIGGTSEDPQDLPGLADSSNATNGVRTIFQIYKTYTSGNYSFYRKITRPVSSTLKVYVDTVLKTVTTDYTIDYATGLITFNSPPGTFAARTLTSDTTNVADGDTVTIGGKVYTFQNSLTNFDGHVLIAGSAAASLTNLFHAINRSGGVIGTDYATATVAHTTVTATNPTATTLIATAKVSGTSGNAITVTTASGGTPHLAWASGTLVGGTNGTVSIVCEFDVPVRFDTDKCNVVSEIYAAQSISSLTLTEIKE
jgi:uncharacterized protein (TIGR02217 family)